LEERGLLHAAIDLPEGGQIHALNVHLSLFGRGRRAQYAKIAERISQAVPAGCPTILAGDFNDWAGEASEELGQGIGLREAHELLNGRLARTFPGFLPFLPLDRVYIRGLEVTQARVLSGEAWATLSDHCPVVVEAKWPTK